MMLGTTNIKCKILVSKLAVHTTNTRVTNCFQIFNSLSLSLSLSQYAYKHANNFHKYCLISRLAIFVSSKIFVKRFGVAVTISACNEEGWESNMVFTTNHHDRGFHGFPLFAGNY